ncbi:uncharacterized protein L3040_001929 [Drepanopeziza brunnea f. sp. 'multigermtubi']|uniref:Epoxide hydrolase n=1 Tax=Marssonina brunnea f. sp. multigermtubi (strain MB_m1) TaxID=1072389 RepID=K1XFZ1_MARBU|nr:epoxide hydrolase [Drepanopeziza brunnea f. sp. 'multigermtubi' MB_m1]EKD19723.1 epoxide hydrolase [Drepanopeziza brunnea f. sp. 'multigermtubi' MB_m1]KAJ5052170.1 hypothetical protein L3040_001929 [Drepanopeziza brunnea f. sp. 'multigermtubi']
MDYPYSTFAASRGYTYSYIHLTPRDSSKPYLLFLHGFPGSSYDWRHQVPYLAQRGYGIIVPDLLGYGRSSKPLDMNAYRAKGMSEDLVELLASEGITQVICVAHDWGSFLASRMANYVPDLFRKIAFLDVGYSAPGQGLTTQVMGSVNASMEKAMGYALFGYFLFFDEEDAAALMDAHVDSVQSLMHSSDNELAKQHMGATGGMRQWLNEGRVAEREEWLEPEAIQHDRWLFGRENGGYATAINWYRAQLRGFNAEDDGAISEASTILKPPVLLVTTDNFISAAADMAGQMKASAPQLEVRKLAAGHWVMLQRKAEVNAILAEFVADIR